MVNLCHLSGNSQNDLKICTTSASASDRNLWQVKQVVVLKVKTLEHRLVGESQNDVQKCDYVFDVFCLVPVPSLESFPAQNWWASTGNDERSHWEPQLIVIVKLLAEVLNNRPVNNPFDHGRAIRLLFVRHANSKRAF